MSQLDIIEKLKSKYPAINFKESESDYWSSLDSTVYYKPSTSGAESIPTILHETSHGILKHEKYKSDFQLILIEIEAWNQARTLASTFNLEIDENHIEDCLDSYRDWQYKRSLCPSCELGGVQINQKTYRCLFCKNSWHVSEARFCRPYRRKA